VTAPEDVGPVPRVSVCMVTFNHARWIGQAVESVLGQKTRFPWELVIGEDDSTDGTRERVAEYARLHPGRIRALMHERNLGPQRNTLAALAACRSEYVAILEGDDYWTDPEKLQLQVDRLDAEPAAALCFHQALVQPEDGGASWVVPRPGEAPFTIEGLLRRNFIPTASVMFRRACFDGFPDWYPQIATGDWLWHILVARRGALAFIPRVMCVYRLHAGTHWSGRAVIRRIEATIPLFERLEGVMDERFRPRLRAMRRRLRIWLFAERLTGGRFQRALDRLRGRRR
jgi:glycosyltransferase involved in cell wall biosynthesis